MKSRKIDVEGSEMMMMLTIYYEGRIHAIVGNAVPQMRGEWLVTHC